VEHPYWMMHFRSPHLVTSLVVRNVGSLAIHHNQQKRGPSGNSQLPPAEKPISVPAAERDHSRGASSVASTIQGQISTPSSSLNNPHVADIAQRVTSTPSDTQWRAIITPTATPGSGSHYTPPPSGTVQTDSTHRVLSSPPSSIASTLTPVSGLENLPTPIANPEAHAIITNPLRTRATERNQRQR